MNEKEERNGDVSTKWNVHWYLSLLATNLFMQRGCASCYRMLALISLPFRKHPNTSGVRNRMTNIHIYQDAAKLMRFLSHCTHIHCDLNIEFLSSVCVAKDWANNCNKFSFWLSMDCVTSISVIVWTRHAVSNISSPSTFKLRRILQIIWIVILKLPNQKVCLKEKRKIR